MTRSLIPLSFPSPSSRYRPSRNSTPHPSVQCTRTCLTLSGHCVTLAVAPPFHIRARNALAPIVHPGFVQVALAECREQCPRACFARVFFLRYVSCLYSFLFSSTNVLLARFPSASCIPSTSSTLTLFCPLHTTPVLLARSCSFATSSTGNRSKRKTNE